MLPIRTRTLNFILYWSIFLRRRRYARRVFRVVFIYYRFSTDFSMAGNDDEDAYMRAHADARRKRRR